jgi:transposase-like protein
VTTEKFPRRLIRKLESRGKFPLVALGTLPILRRYIDEIEAEAIHQAREMGASADDIAEALGITRQGAYYKLKQLQRSEARGKEGNAEDLTVKLPETEDSNRAGG